MKFQILKNVVLLSFLTASSTLLVNCSKDDSTPATQNIIPTPDPNPNQEPVTNSTESNYTFADDGMTCKPISQGRPFVSTVHVISEPCQSSSAALTFYFDLSKPIKPGTYKIKPSSEIDVLTGAGNTTMVFYNHKSKYWYAQSGTVTVSTNTKDATKLDVKWSNLEVSTNDGDKTTFTGQLIGV